MCHFDIVLSLQSWGEVSPKSIHTFFTDLFLPKKAYL